MRMISLITCLVFVGCPTERIDGPPANDAGPSAGTDAGGGTPDAGSQPPSSAEMAESAVEELCRFVYGCFDQSRMMKGVMGLAGGSLPQVNDCATEVTQDTEAVAHLIAAIDAGRIVMDKQAFDTCMATASCSEDLNDGERGLPCDQAITGTVAAGSGCFFDMECVGAGQTHRCSAEEAQCGTCIALTEQGGNCSDDSECLDGLRCRDEDDNDQETCETSPPLLAAGVACDATNGPMEGNCDIWNDLICVADEEDEDEPCRLAGGSRGGRLVVWQPGLETVDEGEEDAWREQQERARREEVLL